MQLCDRLFAVVAERLITGRGDRIIGAGLSFGVLGAVQPGDALFDVQVDAVT